MATNTSRRTNVPSPMSQLEQVRASLRQRVSSPPARQPPQQVDMRETDLPQGSVAPTRGGIPQPQQNQPQQNREAEQEQQRPLTRYGVPDRRYKGQRDLPDEVIINSNYTRPASGWVDATGRHRTSTGKPDLRFKENRMLNPEEAELLWAEAVLAGRGHNNGQQ